MNLGHKLIANIKEIDMKKGILLLLFLLVGCAFPQTPTSDGLIIATKQFRPELFVSGARGEVIISMSDNVSDDGFFSTNYTNLVAFRNVQSGEVYSLSTLLGEKAYDTAMLSIGTYEVINLYLQYVYQTTEVYGSMQTTTTHIVTDEHYEGDKKIRFTVKPGEVVYIGHIDFIKAENTVRPDGSISVNTFKISDKSKNIPEEQRQKWQREFGKDFTVDIAVVK